MAVTQVEDNDEEEALPRGRLVEYEVYEWRKMKPPLQEIIAGQKFRKDVKKWMTSYWVVVAAGVSFLWGFKGEIPWVLQKLLSLFQ